MINKSQKSIFDTSFNNIEHIENFTTLYEANYLGYPWYQAAIEHINNAISKKKSFEYNSNIYKERYKDFEKKIKLLSNKIDYLFITKSKQYRLYNTKSENYLFYDVIDHILNQNKNFLILDIPENSTEHDLSYMNSKFSEFIIPYDCFQHSCINNIQIQIEKISNSIKKSFLSLISKNCNQSCKICNALSQTYINMSHSVVKHKLTIDYLLKNQTIKAIIGSMGTHFMPGLCNNYSIIEIGHGIDYNNVTDVSRKIYSSRVSRYINDNFFIHKCFALMLSNPLFNKPVIAPSIYHQDNVFNYGIPELRHYDFSDRKIESLKSRLEIYNQPVLLIATSNGYDSNAILNLISNINKYFPEISILVRQHPIYDELLPKNDDAKFTIVTTETLYDILYIADIVISPPSSLLHEASFFTDNLILYTRSIDFTNIHYQDYYPCRSVVQIDEITKFISIIKSTLFSDKKTKFSYSDNSEIEITKLFNRVESQTTQKPNMNKYYFLHNTLNIINTNSSNSSHNTNTESDNFINIKLTSDFIDLYIVRTAILNQLSSHKHLFSGTLLDVGCGQMPYKDFILDSQPLINSYIGLDFSYGKYANLKHPDITWDGVKIPLNDNSIDCAIATEVLEHCYSPLVVLAEIRRVLKPGGLFFFTTPFLWPIHDAPHDHYRYTPYALQRLLAEAGFEDVQISALGGWNAALAQMIGLWLRRAPMAEAVRNKLTSDLYALYTELVRTDVAPTDFSKNPMVTGLSGTAKAPVARASQNAVDNEPRVVVVTDQFPILSQTFILEQMTGLIDRGVGVEHWSMERMGSSVVHDSVIKYSLLDSTKFISLPPDTLRPFPTRWAEQFLRINSLPPLDNVEAVQIHFGPNFNKLAPLFSAYPKLFVMVSFHGYDGSATLKIKGADVYTELFARADMITTPSAYMKDTLVQFGCPENKILVHHYGKDVGTFSPTQRQEGSRPVRLLTAARFVEKKGLEYSLAAFAKAQAGLSAQYRIVGYGELESELKALTVSLGVADKVVFLGQLTNDEVRQEMAAADIFVLTSVTAANGDQEGVPVSLIEAQALALPVVSSRHAGIPELVEHTKSGFLAEERNVEEIAGYLRVLIKNPAIRKAFSANAREKVLREFDLAKLNDSLAAYLTRRGHGREMSARKDGQGNDSADTSGEKPHPATVYCPICRSRHDQFRPFGTPPRANALCPTCTSLERHRALWLFLERCTDFFASPNLRMLHFAPEACLERRFRQLLAGYVTADLLDSRADVRADITALQFNDASFDIVYCSHVLEHVPDDHKAMRELYRVLDSDGLAIVMVPLRGAVTEEDLSITDPQERARRYGQADHVRYYGMDIVTRLQAAGFDVQRIDTHKLFVAQDIAGMRLGSVQILLCRKPPTPKPVPTDDSTAHTATNNNSSALAKAHHATARHWSTSRSAPRTRWWMHPAILRHINTVVSGTPVNGPWAGLERRMRQLAPRGTFARGLSVGCGNASKELHLLHEGIVEHFDLFDLSRDRVERGRSAAVRQGVSERATFHLQDAFALDLDDQYDLVYWNNALHHMYDVREALVWSRERLRPGGWLVMDDFVGATRFQWPDAHLKIANRVRQSLPERLMRDPANPQQCCPTCVTRPGLNRMLASDPSEAADSGNILPALTQVFPDAQITLTGGVIYNLALENIIANFDDIEDAALLQELLTHDAELAAQGQTQYACAFASR